MMNYTTKDKNDMIPVQTLNHLTGKAAVFVRGFIDWTDTQKGEIPLRKAQEAGLQLVEDLGDTISIPYVSKLTKLLETSGVVEKSRKGRGYVINRGNRFHELAHFLDTDDWGRTIEKEATEETIAVRSQFLDHMSDQGIVRITPDNPLPKAAYQVAIDKFKSGDYDMVFIKKNLDLDVLDYGDHYVDRDSLNSDHAFYASVGD